MQNRSTVSAHSTTVELSVSVATNVGMVRAVNEDSFLAAPPVFLVADGMGGHNAGDQASQAVRSTFLEAFGDDKPTTVDAVLRAIRESNEAVRRIGNPDGSDSRLSGTTLAGIAIVEAGDGAGLHWMAFNIGDSRIYSWDGRVLGQLSVDHSAVQELVDAGVITEEQAAVHPERNVITRAIGASDDVDADVWLLPVGGAQSFLMCSDGLTKEIGDQQIARLLAEHNTETSSISLAEALVEAALAAGGNDNVTAVMVEATSSGVPVDGETTLDRASHSAYLEDTRPRI